MLTLGTEPIMENERVEDESYSNSQETLSSSMSTEPFQPIWQDLILYSRVYSGQNPVSLLQDPISKAFYIVKAYSYHGESVSPDFLREARFCFLNHKNLVQILDIVEIYQAFDADNIPTDYSLIFMEYAPNGDLSNYISQLSQIPESLVRKLFKQLIDGIEYIHSNGFAHLDLKPENVLLGEDKELKICDFELSHGEDDGPVKNYGTQGYKAPEISEGKCKNPFQADIYSAAMILFFIKTYGNVPFPNGAEDFRHLFINDNAQFWEMHCKSLGVSQKFFSEEFKELFNMMAKFNPTERASINLIKSSSWYKDAKSYSNKFFYDSNHSYSDDSYQSSQRLSVFGLLSRIQSIVNVYLCP